MTALAAAALLFLAAPAPGAEAEGPAPAAGPVVDGVILKLPPGEDAFTLEGLVAARSGQPLSARALRRTVTLLYQLGRFSDVTIRAVPSSQGHVVLVVECLPRRVVKAVAIGGARRQVLDDARVRAAVGLAPGDEFWQGRLEAGVERLRAAYLRTGRRQARISASASGETSVEVELLVDEGPPTTVAEVDLGPGLGSAAAELRQGLQTRPGAVLDLDALDQDVRDLRLRLRRAGWLRSHVPEPVLEVERGSARVRLLVEPGPRIAFRFAGNHHFDDRELLAQISVTPDQPLDEAALDNAVARLRAFYQERGWTSPEIAMRELPAGSQAVLRFEIDEGRRYLVQGIRFSGSTFRGEGWLLDKLQAAFAAQEPPDTEVSAGDPERLGQASGTGQPRRGRPQIEPGLAWYEPAFQQAVGAVVDQIRGDGHLEAVHEGTRVTLDARSGTAEVEIRLRPGPRTRVESVAFEGNAAIGLPLLLEAARIAPGDPLSFAAVEQTRAALLALYAGKGHLYARVQDAETFSADRTLAALRFRIEEGPQVHVATLDVVGNKRTREDVVRASVELKAGDVYDPAAVARSQTALLRLGVFRSVGLHLNDPEVPETEKDLTVELVERPWRTLSPGLGFSLANGPRGFVEYSQPNLFGQALELAGRAKVNYPLVELRPDLRGTTPVERIEGYANVGLRYPRLHFLPIPVGVHLDAIGEATHRKAYDLVRVSTVLGFDAALWGRTTLSLQGELEVDDIQKKSEAVTLQDVQRLRFPEGITTLFSLRPTFTLDYRDNPLHPRRGWLVAVGADYSRSLGYQDRSQGHLYYLFGVLPGSQNFTDMLKLDATLSFYLPVGRKVVLAFSARAGRVLPLSPDSTTIGPKRFFLGGASTMRGSGEDEMIPEDRREDSRREVAACSNSLSGLGCTQAGREVIAGNPPTSEGGEAYLLGKAEARVGLGGSLEAGFFLDAGNLWLNPVKSSLAELRLHVGLGLRFVTPIGPAAVDVGFNTAPDLKLAERRYAPHFSIGLF